MQPLENIMAAWSADKPEVKEERPIGKRKGIFRQMSPEPLESAKRSMPTSPSPEDLLMLIEEEGGYPDKPLEVIIREALEEVLLS
jgi:hypothetical protein